MAGDERRDTVSDQDQGMLSMVVGTLNGWWRDCSETVESFMRTPSVDQPRTPPPVARPQPRIKRASSSASSDVMKNPQSGRRLSGRKKTSETEVMRRQHARDMKHYTLAERYTGRYEVRKREQLRSSVGVSFQYDSVAEWLSAEVEFDRQLPSKKRAGLYFKVTLSAEKQSWNLPVRAETKPVHCPGMSVADLDTHRVSVKLIRKKLFSKKRVLEEYRFKIDDLQFVPEKTVCWQM